MVALLAFPSVISFFFFFLPKTRRPAPSRSSSATNFSHLELSAYQAWPELSVSVCQGERGGGEEKEDVAGKPRVI